MTAVPYQYVRLIMYGTIQSVQTWSTGISVWSPSWGGITNGDLATWLTSLDSAAKTWWTASSSAAALNAAPTLYLGIRAEAYDPGATVATAGADHPFSSAQVGSLGSFGATQNAVVVSCLTDLAGRHQRGRMYVPATGSVASTGNKLTNAAVDGLANATAAYMTAINATTLAGSAPSCIVRGNITLPGDITRVRVDNEIDIQRRRADKLIATYSKITTV